METLYKFTKLDGNSCHDGSGQWSLPQGDQPGEWMPPVTPRVCHTGYHLVIAQYILEFAGPALWIAEGRGACDTSEPDNLCFEQARLIRRVDGWNERTLRLFACDCAGRVMHLAKDARVPACIAVVRRFVVGEASAEELAAGEAAEAACAAGEAAGAAGWAAGDACWAAGEAAEAAEPAESAACAAGEAAGAAGWAAAGAAEAAEHQWQVTHLLDMLGIARGGDTQ